MIVITNNLFSLIRLRFSVLNTQTNNIFIGMESENSQENVIHSKLKNIDILINVLFCTRIFKYNCTCLYIYFSLI